MNTIDSVQSEPGAFQQQPLVVGLDQADQERAEHGAGQVADAAEHGGGEGDQAEREALVVANHRLRERVDEPGGAGERAGEQERERDRAVDVDPHDRARLHVLGGRAHRLALLGAADEVHEPEEHRDVSRTTIGVVHGTPTPPTVKAFPLGRTSGKLTYSGPFQISAIGLEDEADADRGDQRRESRRVSERPVGDELDRRVDRARRGSHDRMRITTTSGQSPAWPAWIPNQDANVTENIPPSMNTSPWAKLISSRMP